MCCYCHFFRCCSVRLSGLCAVFRMRLSRAPHRHLTHPSIFTYPQDDCRHHLGRQLFPQEGINSKGDIVNS